MSNATGFKALLCRSATIVLGLCAAVQAHGQAVSATAGDQSATVAPAKPAAAISDGSLTLQGVTLYGVIDVGVAYLSHGAPLSSSYVPGLPFLIQKFSDRPTTSVAPNGLGQSKIGLSGREALTSDISAIFKVETGFQPTSGQLADGLKSLVHSNGVALSKQTTSGDSSRAGQAFQSAAYVGLQSKTFGTLTFGRQNGLLLDAIAKYDPQAQSPAFSPIGYSGTASGGGDTEDSRLDQTLKYAVQRGVARIAVMHQFGRRGELPAGADEVDVGGDLRGFSVDAVYSHVSDAVSASSLTTAQNLVHPDTLAATISDNTAYSVQGRCAQGALKLYAGYEHIEFENPHTPITAGETDIGDYDLSYVNNTAYTRHKILQVSWVGARYSVSKALELSTGYYRYDQNSYKGNGCSDNSASSCSGTMNAGSVVADYHFTTRFDVYGGVNYSSVQNGLSSGYLKTSVYSPMVGVRVSF